MPKISVIIPVYNVEPYLRECLDSVVNQSFRDIEIICVNDGSTDGSPAILEEYAAKDSRIIVINQQNGGLSVARNNGMKAAKGDYILFVDSDDYIKLNTLEITYNAAIETGAEMVMFYICFNPSDHSTQIKAPCSISNPVEDLLSKIQLAFFQGPSSCKWLWNKKYLERMDLHFIEGLKFEDVPLVINAALHSNFIKVIPYQLYFYRQHIDTITKKRNSNYCDYSWLSYKLALESVKDLSLSDECLWVFYSNKLALIWVGYCNWTPSELLSRFRQNIKDSVFPHEYEWIKSKKLNLTNEQLLFFVGIYGNRFAQAITYLKIIKENVADWLAKNLIAYSPWLQHTLEIVDRQREQIQKLQEELENSQDE